MSKLKAPIYNYKSKDKTPVMYYQTFFGNFYLGNKKSYVDSDRISFSHTSFNCPNISGNKFSFSANNFSNKIELINVM